MDNSSEENLKKRKSIIEQNITNKRGKDVIIKEYKKLYSNSLDGGFIPYHQFKEVKTIQKEMVEENQFYICKYCNIVFYNENEKIKDHIKTTKMDKQFLKKIRTTMRKLSKMKDKATHNQIRPGIDDVFLIAPYNQKITCYQNDQFQEKTEKDQSLNQLSENEKTNATKDTEQTKEQQRKLAEQFYYQMSVPNTSECEDTEYFEETINTTHDYISDQLELINEMIKCYQLSKEIKNAVKLKEETQKKQIKYKKNYQSKGQILKELEVMIQNFEKHITDFKREVDTQKQN